MFCVKDHQPIDMEVSADSRPRHAGGIAKADNKKDRKDDIDQSLHVSGAIRTVRPPISYGTASPSKWLRDHHAVKCGGDMIRRFVVHGRRSPDRHACWSEPPVAVSRGPSIQAILREMGMGRMRITSQRVKNPDIEVLQVVCPDVFGNAGHIRKIGQVSNPEPKRVDAAMIDLERVSG